MVTAYNTRTMTMITGSTSDNSIIPLDKIINKLFKWNYNCIQLLTLIKPIYKSHTFNIIAKCIIKINLSTHSTCINVFTNTNLYFVL